MDRVRRRAVLPPAGTGGCASIADGASRTLVLPAALSAPRHARRLVAGTCEAVPLPEPLVHRVVLMVSEAVTNAVLHARGRPAVTITAGAAGVRVAVGDDSERLPRLRGEYPGPHAVGGRGMGLIEDLADCWGWRVRPDRPGKVVWFEVHASPTRPEHLCERGEDAWRPSPSGAATTGGGA